MSAGRSSRRDWGWHPLKPVWAERLVAESGVRRGDLVVDLGAGTGAITRPLLGTGARVIALELHRGRAAQLRAIDDDRLTVVEADVRQLLLPRRPFKVVASPPYSAASAILRRLLARGTRLTSAHLVVQRAFAKRVLDGNLTGLREARRYTAEIALPLPRSAFSPPPKVDSVVLHIRRGS